MVDLIGYVGLMAISTALLALALSVYIDGLGYVVLHLLGVAGIGAYTYAILTVVSGWPIGPALVLAVLLGAIAGLIGAELMRPLRQDSLMLASFALGVTAFELLRASPVTRGVLGISGVPPLFAGAGPSGNALAGLALLALAYFAVLRWRSSVGGRIVSALRQDEWGAVSLGAQLGAHQRITGCLAGGVAAMAGCQLVGMTAYVEPNYFRATDILLPLGAVIIAGGRTPTVVVLVSSGLVLLSQLSRLFAASPAGAGPASEMAVSGLLMVCFVVVRQRAAKRRQELERHV